MCLTNLSHIQKSNCGSDALSSHCNQLSQLLPHVFYDYPPPDLKIKYWKEVVRMSNTVPTLTLMAGLPGVGKTTLARMLADDLHWKVIDKDGRIEKLLLEGEKDENEASRQAYNESFNAVRESLQSNHSVILDTATLHSFILEEGRNVASKMHVQLKVIFLVAECELRHDRIRRRPPQITVIREDPKTIDEYFLCFKHLPEFPDRFTLDTSKPLLESFMRAKEYLTSSILDREKLIDDEKDLRSNSRNLVPAFS